MALRKNSWETEQKRISYYDSKKMIPLWKKDKPELKEVHSHTLQDVTMRVDLAFQAFFRRLKAGEKAVTHDLKVKVGMTVLLIFNQDSLYIETY